MSRTGLALFTRAEPRDHPKREIIPEKVPKPEVSTVIPGVKGPEIRAKRDHERRTGKNIIFDKIQEF